MAMHSSQRCPPEEDPLILPGLHFGWEGGSLQAQRFRERQYSKAEILVERVEAGVWRHHSIAD